MQYSDTLPRKDRRARKADATMLAAREQHPGKWCAVSTYPTARRARNGRAYLLKAYGEAGYELAQRGVTVFARWPVSGLSAQDAPGTTQQAVVGLEVADPLSVAAAPEPLSAVGVLPEPEDAALAKAADLLMPTVEKRGLVAVRAAIGRHPRAVELMAVLEARVKGDGA
jgi:hypothetical protein